MANVIKHKRGSGSDPSASDLVVGEVAIRTDVGKLFTKTDSGTVSEIAGGGSDIVLNTLSSSSGTGGGSATFNGSAYRFTLSQPPSVSAYQLLVSINGIIQKPVTGTSQPSEGFAVDGNDIILGDAPATGADYFILTFKSLGVSEPADNSVTSAKIVDGAIVNADINASAAIAGTKISPDFGSQTITTTGNLNIGDITLTDSSPSITFTENDANPDYKIVVNAGQFRVEDTTNSADRLVVNSDGHIDIGGNLDVGAGIDVVGNITVTGTVDGVDIAALSSTVSGLSNTTINNNADNRIITGSGTANTLNGESVLTFDNSTHTLTVHQTDTGNNPAFKSIHRGSAGSQINAHFTNYSNANHTVILHDGSVGIGTQSPNSWDVDGDDLVVSTSGHTGITINSGSANSTSRGTIYFAEGTGGDSDKTRGAIQYKHGDDYIRFITNTGERVRIDSAGSFMVGTTTSRTAEFSHPDGFSVRGDVTGQVQSTVTDETCMLINRDGTDGQIIGFRKDGSGIGEIGVAGSSIYVQFGSTSSAAHRLDDYEEGSFSVTMVGQYGGNANYSYRAGYYTRIGRVVHATGDVRFNGSWSGSGGNVYIQLPFGTSFASGGTVGNGSIAEWNLDSSTYDYLGLQVDNNSTVARITTHDGNNNNTGMLHTGQLGNGRYLKFGFTYITS